MPKFRRVTSLFRAATPDGPDEDYTPELEALNGQVEFVPRFRGGVIAYPHLDPPKFVRPEPIQAVLQDGRVMTQVSVGEETVIQPVELLVSDDDEATQSWQWEAVFSGVRVGRWGDEVSISPLRFTVPDETDPLDLTEVVGEKSGNTVTVKGPRGVGVTGITAEDGQLIIEWGDSQRAVIPVPEAVPGPKGDKGEDSTVPGPPGTVDLIGGSATITVSKQAGTSVKVGDVLVHYESGWRDISAAAQSLTTGRLTIRRVGNVVSLVGGDVKFSSSGTFTIRGLIPYGFRPDSLVNALAVQLGGADAYRVAISEAGNFSVFSYEGGWIRWGLVWLTSNPVPTELPGVAT